MITKRFHIQHILFESIVLVFPKGVEEEKLGELLKEISKSFNLF